MKIAILKERRPGEDRVAASPDVVKKLVGLGMDVTVEKGAGAAASITSAKTAIGKANIVWKVQRPMTEADGGTDEVALLKPGQALLCHLGALTNKDLVAKLAEAKVTAFAMELMPRISRAQSMDILSSQSNLAGYRAVIEGAYEFGRAYPLMMTAAGTVPPARVLVFGAGVAGL
ncbi:MAG: NAD(P)(+) transhydrogenase (Re/Si-specific) subunit alpha, partial [Rhodospirillaceae bacterium]